MKFCGKQEAHCDGVVPEGLNILRQPHRMLHPLRDAVSLLARTSVITEEPGHTSASNPVLSIMHLRGTEYPTFSRLCKWSFISSAEIVAPWSALSRFRRICTSAQLAQHLLPWPLGVAAQAGAQVALLCAAYVYPH